MSQQGRRVADDTHVEPDPGEHHLHPGPIAHVHPQRGPAVLVTEAFSHLDVQHRLKHVLRQLIQQAT